MAVKNDMARILAALEGIPQGPAAVQAAANQILAALGVKASDLLRAKAEEFNEMAALIDACNDSKAADAPEKEAEAEQSQPETEKPAPPSK